MPRKMSARVPVTTVLCDQALAGLPQLLNDLQILSEDQDSCDVLFLLGREEERLYAHKIILMARYLYIFFINFIANKYFKKGLNLNCIIT